MKKLKRFTKAQYIALLWAIAFIAGLLPLQAQAASETSGTCGTNASWSYDTTDKILTITGSGSMNNYNEGEAPWTSYANEISRVVISDRMEKIGDYAFVNTRNLSEVTIPASVYAIGSHAFDNSGLTSVTIPDTVYTIGSYAFTGCLNLTSVTISKSLSNFGIADSTFSDCNKLSEVTIPVGVTSIGKDAFRNCTALRKVTIPEGVTTIGETAFAYSGLSQVTIPASVTSIGAAAFQSTSLSQVAIPGKVGTIQNRCFMDCKKLTKVTIPANVGRIEYSAFMGCTSLAEVTIPASVSDIGNSVFYGCKALEQVVVKRTTPAYLPSNSDMFKNCFFVTNERKGIQVPAEAYFKYTQGNQAYGWKEWAKYIYKSFEGSGTKDNPYQINSKDDFEILRDLVNGGKDFSGSYFNVTEDIDLEGGADNKWTPIGTADSPFKGIFDGDGHTISGLYIDNSTADNQGLFGVNEGTVENLTVKGSVTGNDYVGGIAGTNNGSIQNCTSVVAVNGVNNVGGLAGNNAGVITGSTNQGAVNGTGDNTGGIAGTNGTNGTVTGSTNCGNVTGKTGGTTTGAIIGKNQNTDTEAVKDDYYQKTDTINKDLTGIGDGTGEGTDPEGITSGNKPIQTFEGSGTEESPYKIKNESDLKKLAQLVNSGLSGEGEYYTIEGDITLTDESSPWTPIGTTEHPFNGILDGNNHTISGLQITNNEADNQGLFGVNAGTIENLIVKGSVTGKDNVGGIAGTNTGSIKNCTSEVTVNGVNNVGGIAGANDGTVTGCTNKGSVTGTGNNTGGITGSNTETGTITDSENQEGATVTGKDNTGGITGSNAGTVNNSNNTGSVNGSNNVGGVAGNNAENGKVENSTNSGSVTGTGTGAGGVAGNNEGTLKDDTNTATVTGKNDVGGIAGTNGTNGTVTGSTNSGNVTGNTGGTTTGAIIGKNQNTDTEAVKDDYYQKTDTINKDLTGIGDGTGEGTDPEGITSGNKPVQTFEGSGTKESPYKIKNESDLKKLAQLVNSGLSGEGEYYTIEGDITLTDESSPWTPIGTTEHPFNGILDGNNHTISGLQIANSGADNQGLFGVNAGTIENLIVKGSVTGKDNVGGIAGTNTGSIKNCTSEVTVNGVNNVGGIVGANDGTVTGCTNKGSVAGTGNNTGGIAGTNGTNGTVTGSTNSGNVTGNTEGTTTGAIIGKNQNTSLEAVKDDYYQKTNTINKDLTGIGDGIGAGTDPAGITTGETPIPPKAFEGAGTAEDPYKITGKEDLEKLRDLLNSGKDFAGSHFIVTADIALGGSEDNKWTPIGTTEHPFNGILDGNNHTISGLQIANSGADNQGLFGVNAGTIENLIVKGSVTGKDNVGGIAGTNTGIIKNCTSEVTVNGVNNVGGIVGANDGTVTGCTNKGTVTGTGDNTGGIAGTNGTNGTVTGSTNSGNVTGNTEGTATGAIIGKNQNTSPEAVKDNYYQKTDTINKDLTGVGEGSGAGTDPAGITSGKTPEKPDPDKEAAASFENEKITAIKNAGPVGGAAWKQAVQDAQKAYDSLTDSQKNLVSENAKKSLTDAQAVLMAVEKVEAIGQVANTAESAGKIQSARSAYDGLTNDQKAMVPESTKKILTDAEAAYAALQKGTGEQEKLTAEQKKEIETIAKGLGVTEETAAKIQKLAEELGVPVETLMTDDNTILNQKSEDDLKGSTFYRIQARASRVDKKSTKLTWKKVKGADGYLIYASQCGKARKLKLIKTIKKGSTQTYTYKKLKKGTSYKYVVRAYKNIDGKRVTLAVSKMIHIFTDGGKYGNAKLLKVNKTKVSIKKGKKFKIKASEVKKNKPLKRHRKICYESDNKKVATVDKKGVVQAKAKGTCTVYVYAQNGMFKKIKVTVK